MRLICDIDPKPKFKTEDAGVVVDVELFEMVDEKSCNTRHVYIKHTLYKIVIAIDLTAFAGIFMGILQIQKKF